MFLYYVLVGFCVLAKIPHRWEMKFMKKNTISTIVIVLLILILGIPIIYYVRWNSVYSNIIKINWGIELSKQYKEIYSLDSGPSFHGDGERYHIFQYDDNKYVRPLLLWRDEKDLYLEENVKNIVANLNIPEKYTPDFSRKYNYYYKTDTDSSKIYIIFFHDLNRLYIIEQFL